MVLEFVPGGPIMDWVHTPDGGMFASPLTGAVLGEERADWAIADVLNGLACVPTHFSVSTRPFVCEREEHPARGGPAIIWRPGHLRVHVPIIALCLSSSLGCLRVYLPSTHSNNVWANCAIGTSIFITSVIVTSSPRCVGRSLCCAVFK
jgi:hypothetical protein